MKHHFTPHCLLLLLLLAGCSGQPVQTQTPDLPADPLEQTSTALALIEKAEGMETSAYASALYLQAAQLLHAQENNLKAKNILNRVSPRQLSPEKLRAYLALGFQLSLSAEDTALAKKLLEQSGLMDFTTTQIEQRIQLSELKAEALALTGQHFQAALTRINTANLLDGDQYVANIEKIWQELRQTSGEELTYTIPESPSSDLAGWLSLAKSLRSHLFNLNDQIKSLTQWQALWPEHPAALHLPGELAMMIRLPELRPKHITLALPLSGRLADAGQAILQGFLQSYYLDSYRLDGDFELSIQDTGAMASPQELAFSIDQLQPDLVIGPLRKSWVEALKQQDTYHQRTLAFNYTLQNSIDAKETQNNPENFFEFGLAYDDEINQIEDAIVQRDLHQILLYCPDDGWGRRNCAEAKESWQSRNGVVVEETYYNPKSEHTKTVEKSLKINESKARKYELQRILDERLEFNPVRRQDVQAIFLISDPVNGRQIKPLLSFYYAGDLPVYALSRIYSGDVDMVKDQDLNGILFTEIPWSLQQTNAQKTQLVQSWPELATNYSRLFALGIDAYLLAPRLPLIEKIPYLRISGNTGDLYSIDGHSIRRRLDWATFSGGKAQATSIR